LQGPFHLAGRYPEPELIFETTIQKLLCFIYENLAAVTADSWFHSMDHGPWTMDEHGGLLGLPGHVCPLLGLLEWSIASWKKQAEKTGKNC